MGMFATLEASTGEGYSNAWRLLVKTLRQEDVTCIWKQPAIATAEIQGSYRGGERSGYRVRKRGSLQKDPEALQRVLRLFFHENNF